MGAKQAALKEIQAVWPQSLNLLKFCMNCFAVHSHDGQIFPTILMQDDSLALGYHLRMKDARGQDIFHQIKRMSEVVPAFHTPLTPAGKLVLPDLTGFDVHIPMTDSEQLYRVHRLLKLIYGGRRSAS